MFGMGTGGTLRLLSPEIWGLFTSLSLSLRTLKTTQEIRFRPRTGFQKPGFLHPDRSAVSQTFSDQALDLLVSSTCIRYRTSSDDLSTSSSLRGLTHLL